MTEEVENLITLDAEQLDKEITDHTAHLSRTGALLAQAVQDLMVCEVDLKRLEGFLFLDAKKQGELTGIKVTDAKAKQLVTQSEEWYKAQMRIVTATARRDRLRADLRALESKGRHLDLLGRRATEEIRAYRK